MKENSNFYRLKSPHSARVEGHVGKVSFFLIFSLFFTAGFLLILIITLVKGSEFSLEAYICFAVFGIVITAFLFVGIRDQIKGGRQNEAERRLLNDCLCTDGKIIWCTAVRRETSSKSSSNYYNVTMEYSFTDDKNKLRRCSFTADYSYNPDFYNGQHLMIAFNDTDSIILGEFSFVEEDEERFLQNEAARSDDDFDELDGSPLEVDPNRKIQSAELEHVWFWAAFALFIFVAAFTIPISIFVAPKLINGIVILDILLIFLLYLTPAVFTAVIVYFIVKYIKLRRRFKKILNNEPSFVWGKIFASEKTYRHNARKTVFYCYIDGDGNRFTKSFLGPAVRKAVQGKPIDVAVMYDKDGNSVPLYSYKFTDEK